MLERCDCRRVRWAEPQQHKDKPVGGRGQGRMNPLGLLAHAQACTAVTSLSLAMCALQSPLWLLGRQPLRST